MLRHGGLTRTTCRVVIAALALGLPNAGTVLAAGPASGAAVGALGVASEPAGADVYLDGELLGRTPLQLERVASGDHRVRVVKPGYLENSRVVSVDAGQTRDVRVKLTPHAEAAQPLVQVEDQSGSGGGGSKKLLLIGAAVVAAGVGAYFLLRNKNEAPLAGTIGVTPAGTAMAGTTSLTFTAQGASDPDNDALTYSWNFGDGTTGSGQSTTKTYASAGSFTVTLTVSDGKLQATATSAVTVARNMAGVWSGGQEYGFGAAFSVNFTQSGGTLGGTLTFSGALTGSIGITGTVSPQSYPATVNFSTSSFTVGGQPGTFQVRFAGTTDANGNSMTGIATSTSTALSPPSISGPATLRR